VPANARSVGLDALDAISRRVVQAWQRQPQDDQTTRPQDQRTTGPQDHQTTRPQDQPSRLLATGDGRDVFVNAPVGADGAAMLVGKSSGARLPLKRPAAACLAGGGHARLSCSSCHTAWAPRCTTCHTAFNPSRTAYDHVADAEVQGAWVETGSGYTAEPPTLGIREERGANGAMRELVETFAPGMVLTLDRTTASRGSSHDTIFRRLYARTAPHTTSRASRSCRSCHNDPVALGYGRGTLAYHATGRWTFTPERPPSPYDRLPADAWVGFLQPRTGQVSTRSDVRPFTVVEQKRILAAGACLTCHEGASAVMREATRDFAAALRRATRRCILPKWD
jgi:hypothetical protein